MRIISQDGTIDVPYEQVIIECEKCNSREDTLYIVYAQISGRCSSIARYSTEYKAKRTMEMLREEYLKTSPWCSEVAYGETNFPKVFQFPSDDEIEV